MLRKYGESVRDAFWLQCPHCKLVFKVMASGHRGITYLEDSDFHIHRDLTTHDNCPLCDK